MRGRRRSVRARARRGRAAGAGWARPGGGWRAPRRPRRAGPDRRWRRAVLRRWPRPRWGHPARAASWCGPPRSTGSCWSWIPPRRPLPSSRGRPGRGSLGGNHAELFHLREDIDDPPHLRDPAAGETEDEDLVVADGLAGWREAHVFTLVGPCNRGTHYDLVPLRDQILDRKVEVGKALEEHRPHLLSRLRPLRFNRQWRANQHVRREDLVHRLRDDLRIPGVDGVLDAPERVLVAGFLGC